MIKAFVIECINSNVATRVIQELHKLLGVRIHTWYIQFISLLFD